MARPAGRPDLCRGLLGLLLALCRLAAPLLAKNLEPVSWSSANSKYVPGPPDFGEEGRQEAAAGGAGRTDGQTDGWTARFFCARGMGTRAGGRASE